jgi:hypothetical protein
MKERDKRKSHKSSNIHIIYIYILLILDAQFLRPSLHFTKLVDSSLPLIETSPNYTSLPSHLAQPPLNP